VKTTLSVTRQEVESATSERPFATNQITYTQTVAYQSSATQVPDLETIVQLPFVDRASKSKYKRVLFFSGLDAFRTVRAVEVLLPAAKPGKEKADFSDGLFGIGFSVVALVVVGWSWRLYQKRAAAVPASNTHLELPTASSRPATDLEVSTVETVRAQLEPLAPLSIIRIDHESRSLSSILLSSSQPKPEGERRRAQSVTTQFVSAVPQLEPDGYRLYDAAAALALDQDGAVPMYKDQIREVPIMASVALLTHQSQPLEQHELGSDDGVVNISETDVED
jgi:hypothetical protein